MELEGRPPLKDDVHVTGNLFASDGEPWLVIFDLDGTLIDSSFDLCDSVNASLRHLGYPTLSEDTVSSFIGDGAATLVERALEASAGLVPLEHPEIFQRCFTFFLNYYRVHKLDTTKVYPGVLESLEGIRSARPDLLMAVLTNKPVRPSREICDALALAPYFFQNYGGDSFPMKKPSPEGLQAILAEASSLAQSRGSAIDHFHPRGVAMIGDSEADVRVGRVCGVRTIGCTYGLAPEALRSAAPDVLVESAWQWKEVLGV